MNNVLTFSQFLKRSSPQQDIILYYTIVVVVTFSLLNLPYAHKPGVEINPIGILFVAISGISITGLSPISIADTYFTFGQLIILVILNIGGIGVMVIGTTLWVVLGEHIGIGERQLIMLDNNGNTISSTVKSITDIIKSIFVVEPVGAMLLAFYLCRGNPDLRYAIMQGVFVSIFVTTDGRLDITGKSLIPCAHDYSAQVITIFLVILRSIGFPVLLEVKAYIQNRATNFRFSSFTKITTSAYLFLFIIGVLAVLLLGHNHAFKGLSWHQSLFHSLFQLATTRNAGFQTIDVITLSDPTDIIMGILTFIGSSPSSVGGGICITTFAILILFLISFSNNADKTPIKVYNREIHIMDIQHSFTVFAMAAILIFLGMLIISATESGELTFLQVSFEVISVFGTCRLSFGVTSDISDTFKVVPMVLMFMERVGLTSFIIMTAGRREPGKFHYPKGRIQIG